MKPHLPNSRRFWHNPPRSIPTAASNGCYNGLMVTNRENLFRSWMLGRKGWQTTPCQMSALNFLYRILWYVLSTWLWLLSPHPSRRTITPTSQICSQRDVQTYAALQVSTNFSGMQRQRSAAIATGAALVLLKLRVQFWREAQDESIPVGCRGRDYTRWKSILCVSRVKTTRQLHYLWCFMGGGAH